MKNKNTNPLLHALLPVAAVIAYVLIGYIFKGKGWAAGWIVFLLIPVIESCVTALKTKNPSAFAYPVFVTAIFLTLGMVFHIWHPTWVLFVTIPAFYAICDYVNKNRQQAAYENPRQNPDMPTPPPFPQSDETPPFAPQVPPLPQNYYNPPKKSAASIVISVIFSITAIVIAAIIGFFSFLGGGFSELVKFGTSFENDSSYTEVNSSAEFNTDSIYSLDIDWIDGSVNIEYYDGEKIYIEENGGSKSHPMCYKVEDGKLKIDEYRNNNWLKFKYVSSKNLTVKLPLTFKADKIDISVVSGNVTANALNIGKLDFETVSGNGDFEFAVSPREIDTDSVSGNVRITLPHDVSGYSASLKTVSGSFSTRDFDNSMHFGDGAVLIDSESVSGDIAIYKAVSKAVTV